MKGISNEEVRNFYNTDDESTEVTNEINDKFGLSNNRGPRRDDEAGRAVRQKEELDMRSCYVEVEETFTVVETSRSNSRRRRRRRRRRREDYSSARARTQLSPNFESYQPSLERNLRRRTHRYRRRYNPYDAVEIYSSLTEMENNTDVLPVIRLHLEIASETEVDTAGTTEIIMGALNDESEEMNNNEESEEMNNNEETEEMNNNEESEQMDNYEVEDEAESLSYRILSENDINNQNISPSWRTVPKYDLTVDEAVEQEVDLYNIFIDDTRHETVKKAKSNDKQCCVCYENKATRVVTPCGHECLCYNCAKTIALNRTALPDGTIISKKCPMCRAAISQMIRPL